MVSRLSIGFSGVIAVTCAFSLACHRTSEPSTIASCAQVAAAGGDASQPVVLYVTQSAGYQHGVLPHSVEVLESVGATGGFVVHHTGDARAAVHALDGCAALMFYTTGNLGLTADEKAQLLDYVSGGGAFVGFHSATDTYYDWPEYGELVGAYFERHPWKQQVTIDVAQPAHESVGALPASFQVSDEIYVFKTFHDERVQVVASLDQASVDTGGITIPPWGVPLAWVQDYDDGRVFYTALGHGAIWDDPQYQALLRSGIGWAIAEP